VAGSGAIATIPTAPQKRLAAVAVPFCRTARRSVICEEEAIIASFWDDESTLLLLLLLPCHKGESPLERRQSPSSAHLVPRINSTDAAGDGVDGTGTSTKDVTVI